MAYTAERPLNHAVHILQGKQSAPRPAVTRGTLGSSPVWVLPCCDVRTRAQIAGGHASVMPESKARFSGGKGAQAR
jgi:hypothetical protein